ncbi:hypothetical protein [Nocardiopsis lambiniae]|uniref:DUF4175 domain-containing protein n=1 Tax=Nocardiopsis lambiniae TaxID=3075539 RepID=A0ABU2ME71_9ACTN|nr:hypothetical protein [Nocardiopsis sp. DSM 44743]MDT0330989.1 hypothetical protein [Nocardiopsis sp. DSM 44743]
MPVVVSAVSLLVAVLVRWLLDWPLWAAILVSVPVMFLVGAAWSVFHHARK